LDASLLSPVASSLPLPHLQAVRGCAIHGILYQTHDLNESDTSYGTRRYAVIIGTPGLVPRLVRLVVRVVTSTGTLYCKEGATATPPLPPPTCATGARGYRVERKYSKDYPRLGYFGVGENIPE
jgi:hypothetical protein